MKLKTPSHYLLASKLGQQYLYTLLKIPVGSPLYNQSLFELAGQYYPTLLQDWLLADACKYLWRLGEKGSAIDDASKSVHYLHEWLRWHGGKGSLREDSIRVVLQQLKKDFRI